MVVVVLGRLAVVTAAAAAATGRLAVVAAAAAAATGRRAVFVPAVGDGDEGVRRAVMTRRWRAPQPWMLVARLDVARWREMGWRAFYRAAMDAHASADH